jgi:hypothetical protein
VRLFFFLWLYSPILGFGRLHETFRFISVTRSRTVGRTPRTGDQLVARPLLTAPGECDDDEVGGMNGCGRGKWSSRRKPAPTPLVHHKSHLRDPGTNPGRRGGKPATNRFSYCAANVIQSETNSVTIFECHFWDLLARFSDWNLLQNMLSQEQWTFVVYKHRTRQKNWELVCGYNFNCPNISYGYHFSVPGRSRCRGNLGSSILVRHSSSTFS